MSDLPPVVLRPGYPILGLDPDLLWMIEFDESWFRTNTAPAAAFVDRLRRSRFVAGVFQHWNRVTVLLSQFIEPRFLIRLLGSYGWWIHTASQVFMVKCSGQTHSVWYRISGPVSVPHDPVEIRASLATSVLGEPLNGCVRLLGYLVGNLSKGRSGLKPPRMIPRFSKSIMPSGIDLASAVRYYRGIRRPGPVQGVVERARLKIEAVIQDMVDNQYIYLPRPRRTHSSHKCEIRVALCEPGHGSISIWGFREHHSGPWSGVSPIYGVEVPLRWLIWYSRGDVVYSSSGRRLLILDRPGENRIRIARPGRGYKVLADDVRLITGARSSG